MNLRGHSGALSCALFLLFGLGADCARAQTTDGYHAVQVFPVVVDTASFTQRFHFRNPGAANLVIEPRYFPADGTSQGTPLTCQTFTLFAYTTRTFTSLRSICPTLASGSQFGFLVMMPTNIRAGIYAAFSRVANPQGNGFSVEAFPAKAFTSAKLVVNGIRRLAATANAPAFQSNCFIGVMTNIDPESPNLSTTVNYTIFDPNHQNLGQGSVVLNPGRMVRLLEVFQAAGIAPGDVDNAAIRFEESGEAAPGILAFCTVQDNTSLGADFRIAKQEAAPGGDFAGPGQVINGPWDDHTRREVWLSKDSLGRPFEINSGNSSNTHVLYLHNPDFGFCEIVNPSTGLRATPGYGLEIRAVDVESGQTGAGGNNSLMVPDTDKGEPLFFGDRSGSEEGGDSRAVIEVESNEQNTGSVRPYILHCRTGSGSSLGDIIRYKEALDRF